MGVLGMLGKNDDIERCGIFLTLTAIPLLVIRAIRETQNLNAAQLAEADNAGYVRALDHVARGLLDQNTAPSPQGGDRAVAEQATGNVITLRPHQHRQSERKAQ
jgi:hypothetical protein